jgi:hypothetical protein
MTPAQRHWTRCGWPAGEMMQRIGVRERRARLGLRPRPAGPTSRSASLTHFRTAVSVRSKSLAT